MNACCITRLSRMAVIRNLQEEHYHLLLISQHNSMTNLICNGDISTKTAKLPVLSSNGVLGTLRCVGTTQTLPAVIEFLPSKVVGTFYTVR